MAGKKSPNPLRPTAKKMRGATVCTGIGGAEVAAGDLIDWRFCSEIDPFANAVLAHRFPKLPNFGNLTEWRSWNHGKLDILCGGTPCQSFSAMGRRRGMADTRGNLALAFCDLARSARARWIVWENVDGVFTSNGGRDFAAFLGALVERGYSVAWRVLDVQLVRSRSFPRTLPQRRRRVFLVGHYGTDCRCAAEALLVAPPDCGDPAARATARSEVAPRDGRIAGAGKNGVAHCLRANAGIATNVASDNILFDEPRPRKLTPLECERLMGFPDGWTDLPHFPATDDIRRRALGNAWGVNAAEWVLDRIAAVDRGGACDAA